MREKAIAQETVATLDKGHYQAPNGSTVDFSALLRHCVEGTHCYSPEELATLRSEVLARPPKFERTTFEVVNETTLEGCTRLLGLYAPEKIGVLNFASAKNPGGGFLSGAKAQEESLARASGLYRSLLRCSGYYQFHRSHKTALYSDRMIYSPRCPVLRKDDGDWLEQPYQVNFITSAAPNAGAIRLNEPERLGDIPLTFHERASKVLALAAAQGCEVLVLGAWGCGAFKNDPRLVADVFWKQLSPSGGFWGRFQTVLFSVFDKWEGHPNFNAFAGRFRSSAQ